MALKRVRYKLGEQVHGPIDVEQLRKVRGFTLQTLVASDVAEDWEPAFKTIDLSAYFGAAQPVQGGTLDPSLQQALNLLTASDQVASERSGLRSPLRTQKKSRFGARLFLAVVLAAVGGGVWKVGFGPAPKPEAWQHPRLQNFEPASPAVASLRKPETHPAGYSSPRSNAVHRAKLETPKRAEAHHAIATQPGKRTTSLTASKKFSPSKKHPLPRPKKTATPRLTEIDI